VSPIPINSFSDSSVRCHPLVGDDRYSSIGRLQAVESWGVLKIQALVEATYFAGLRKAGVPEE
jgi:hypothetical protein